MTKKKERTNSKKKKNKGAAARRNKNSAFHSNTNNNASVSASIPASGSISTAAAALWSMDDDQSTITTSTSSPPKAGYAVAGVQYKDERCAETARLLKACQKAIASHPDMNNNNSNDDDSQKYSTTTTTTSPLLVAVKAGTAAAAAMAATSKQTKIDTAKRRCYHGSSKAAYENPKYIAAISILDPNAIVQDYKSRRLLKDPEFCNYLFARAVDTWFYYNLADTANAAVVVTTHTNTNATATADADNDNDKDIDNDNDSNEVNRSYESSHIDIDIDIDEEAVGTCIILLLLTTALKCRYDFIPQSQGQDTSIHRQKLLKYIRDCNNVDNMKGSRDYRGTINVLVRETKTQSNKQCTCMGELRQEAKKMEKVGLCYGCGIYFPKNQLRLCSKCNFTQYCGRTCQISDWATHKVVCQGMCTEENTSYGKKEHCQLIQKLAGVVKEA